METEAGAKTVHNIPFFMRDGDGTPLASLGKKFGFSLGRGGSANITDICSLEGKEGYFLCSVASKTSGLKHTIGIDYNRNLIWDPAESTALPITTSYFSALLEKEDTDSCIIRLVVVNLNRRKFFGMSWINKDVEYDSNEGKKHGTVKYFEKEGGSRHPVAVISVDGSTNEVKKLSLQMLRERKHLEVE